MNIEQRVRANYSNLVDREFRIGDLFEISHYGKQRSKDDLIQGIPEYNFVMQSNQNNGVIQQVPEQIGNGFNLAPGNTISVFTHLNRVYYQATPFYSKQGSNVYTLTSKILSQKNALYFVSAINKAIGTIEYGKNTASRLIDYSIVLPTDDEGSIAFEYMVEYINELEVERINELESYLKATGLNDYALTYAEKKLIDEFRMGAINWGTFKIVDIFKVKNTKNLLSRDIVKNSGEIPYLTAGEGNNSIGSYISYDLNQVEEGNSIFIGGKTFVVTYQELNYFSNDSHNLALYYKEEDKRTKENQLFLVTSIARSLSHLYSWGDSISNNKIQKDVIKLPIKLDNTPDFDKMSNYVHAIKKLAIKGVVDWKNKQISKRTNTAGL